MADNLRRLRDAVVGRGREVEVTSDGTVREIPPQDREVPQPDSEKPTKLAERTFGSFAPTLTH